MDPLPPIPVPLAARWREFRTRILPVCVTLGLVAATTWLWHNESSSGNFPGIAEGIRSTVCSPQAGALRQVLVQPYQVVEAGDPVAIVVPIDPRGQLDLFQTELEFARLGLEPSVPEQNALDFERLRFDLLRMKSELATAEVNLQLAENQVRRQKPLFEEKLVSEDLFDLSAKTRDSLAAGVRAKSNAVAQMEGRLEQLRPLGEPSAGRATDPAFVLISSLRARHLAALTNWGPITLTAPIAGMVSSVQRRPGEHVLEGEPLVLICSPQSDRVVGYLRQPYSIRPEVGMQARLTTRDWKRRRYLGKVSQVGAQVEFITNSLALLRPGAMVDTGLPIVIDLPADAEIRPGEVIDIEIADSPILPDVPVGRSTPDGPLASQDHHLKP